MRHLLWRSVLGLALCGLVLGVGCNGKDKPAEQGGQKEQDGQSQTGKESASEGPTDYAAADVGQTTAGEGKPSADTGAWPQFRGPNRDNIAPAKGLARSWPEGGPKLLWSIDGLADGYSGPAVHSGKVYFHDYDEGDAKNRDDDLWMVRCVSLADGKEIWRWSYPRLIRQNHGVTRTVPVVDENYVISLDPKCVLHGFDAKTGKRLWAHDLTAEFGTRIPPWYNGQCPLDNGNSVVVGVGGKDVLMAAFNKADGKILWKTPNPQGLPMTHSSVMPMKLAGRDQFVWTTMTGMVGVDAKTGLALWTNKWATEDTPGQWRPKTAEAPSPVAVSDDRIYQSAGYEAGSAMLKVLPGPPMGTQTLFTLTPEQFNSDTHTPVVWKDRLFAVHGTTQLCCVDLDGKIVWRSPAEIEFGLGPWLMADGMFFLLTGHTKATDGGWLHLVEASTEGWKPLAKAKVLDGHDIWAPMALVDGKLICRDLHRMICLDVSAAAE